MKRVIVVCCTTREWEKAYETIKEIKEREKYKDDMVAFRKDKSFLNCKMLSYNHLRQVILCKKPF